MPRDFRSTSFYSSDTESAEDADPRIGLVNLADVMLVFACGLMLALVSYWNLDVSRLTEVVQSQEVTEVDDIEAMQDQLNSVGSGYTELGTVYQDPMTGKLYMLQEDLSSSTSQSASASSPASGQATPNSEE
jgi:hypothetical protein